MVYIVHILQKLKMPTLSSSVDDIFCRSSLLSSARLKVIIVTFYLKIINTFLRKSSKCFYKCQHILTVNIIITSRRAQNRETRSFRDMILEHSKKSRKTSN